MTAPITIKLPERVTNKFYVYARFDGAPPSRAEIKRVYYDAVEKLDDLSFAKDMHEVSPAEADDIFGKSLREWKAPLRQLMDQGDILVNIAQSADIPLVPELAEAEQDQENFHCGDPDAPTHVIYFEATDTRNSPRFSAGYYGALLAGLASACAFGGFCLDPISNNCSSPEPLNLFLSVIFTNPSSGVHLEKEIDSEGRVGIRTAGMVRLGLPEIRCVPDRMTRLHCSAIMSTIWRLCQTARNSKLGDTMRIDSIYNDTCGEVQAGVGADHGKSSQYCLKWIIDLVSEGLKLTLADDGLNEPKIDIDEFLRFKPGHF